MKKIFGLLFLIAMFILLVEFTLRIFYGYGKPFLYVEDPDFEYIPAPDQNLMRVGRQLITNHYCMRSDALAISDSVRILTFGDSILNGGPQTDQDDLATSILERNLSAELKKKIRVLNISAASWGVDNAAAYLKKYGDFGAKLIILIFSSHDLYDNMDFRKVVGVNSGYPDHNPISAIGDCWVRSVLPFLDAHIFNKDSEKSLLHNYNSQHINSGWNFFFTYSQQHRIPLLVYLHAQKNESQQKHYNEYGTQLLQLLHANQINAVEEIKSYPKPDYYRDFIHFNEKGQRFMAAVLKPFIEKEISATK